MPGGFSFGGQAFPSGRLGSGAFASGNVTSPVGTLGGSAEVNQDGMARLLAFLLMPQIANLQFGAQNPRIDVPGGFGSQLNLNAAFPSLGSSFGVSANPAVTLSPFDSQTGSPQIDPTVTVPLLGQGGMNVNAQTPMGGFDLRGDVLDPVMSVLGTLLGY